MVKRYRKHPFHMFFRMAYLFFAKPDNSQEFVKKSYNHISLGYDRAWTTHMRDLTESLINRLNPQKGNNAVDLACGTGFATALIAKKTGTKVIGVDISKGMLEQAQKNCPDSCEFVHADILKYLTALPSESIELATCCWGLGYSRPFAVLKQVKRILKKGGKVGIVDNTIFSLREVLYCSFLTFMEQPEMLINLMRLRFLMASWYLGLLFRILSLKPLYLSDGCKSYIVESGKAAIDRLIKTGAAAGFQYAAHDFNAEQIFQRFAEIIEQKYMKENKIIIAHRYLMGIAKK